MSAVRRWSAIAILILPVLLVSIDMSVLGIAVPALSADLDPSSNQLLWIIDIYSFLLAGLLVLMGSLGDRIGRKRLLLIGAPAFGVASVIAAFSTSPEMLIAARALLGIGGATLMPSTLGLIRTIFPERRERRAAIAVWGAAFSGGAAIGPVLGGWMLEHYWWGSVFLINAPVMVLFLVAAVPLLPESRDPAPGPFDPVSALLIIGGLLPVVYALKAGVRHPDWTAALALVVGVSLLVAFGRRQSRVEHPMLDLGLFRRPGFSPAVMTNVIVVFTLVGVLFFFPQYLMLVMGLGSAEAGTWLLPLAAATVLGSFLSPVFARFAPVRVVIVTGLALITAGLATATRLDDATGMATFALSSVLVGLGSGFAETLTNDVILAAAPPERASAAGAISETGYEFGGAMGTAVLGTLGMAVYARGIAAIDGLTGPQQDAARQTLGAAHELADTLPSTAGEALRAASSASFAHGMDVVATVCSIVILASLVIAWRGLDPRKAPKPSVESSTRSNLADAAGGAKAAASAGVSVGGEAASGPDARVAAHAGTAVEHPAEVGS
ncbi:MAG: MFS transporter [Dermatophilus congolensis]|nr:MFS transporter [Dermatophilus congolensis]